MPKMSNQEIEQYYFEMFRNHYSLPDGVVEYGDKPDVILRGKRKVGIEITNFFLEAGSIPESEQVQRRVRQAAVAKAQHLYQTRNGGKFELTFGFDRAMPIRDANELARKIADLAVSVQSASTGQLGRDVFQHIPELSFAYLNATEYGDARWQLAQTYDGTVLSLDGLKEIIRAKEAKSQDYRPCDAYWLLVVVDFIDRAQDQEIRVDGIDTITSKVFEKIIVYKTFFGHVVESSQ
jgi:hypothetical protein